MKKKCKILKIEDEEYAEGMVLIDVADLNGVEHLTIGCPKCKTTIAVPLSTLKLFLVITRKQQGVV